MTDKQPEGTLDALTSELSRRQLLERAGAAFAAVSLPGLISAGRAAAGGTAEIATLNWALNSPVGALNNYKNTDGVTITALANALEGLLVLDEDLRIRTALAQSWRRPDGKTHIFRLRNGVRFWDGSPLTVDDVVFSMQKQLAGSAQSSFFSTVRSVRATGPREVTFRLKSSDAVFPYSLAIHTRYIVQKRFASRHWKELGAPGVLTMGTGPFQITSFKPDESITLVRNERYWGPKPAVKKLILRILPEANTRLLAMQSGQIDGAFDVTPVEPWQRLNGVNVSFASAFQVFLISMNVEVAPFNDIHVRRAIAHCIDKRGLVQAVLHGHGRTAAGFSEPALWINMLPPAQVAKAYASMPSYDFNLDHARAELKQSAFPNGFTTTVPIASQLYPRVLLAAQNLQQNLAKIGITLNIKEDPADQYFPRLLAHKDLTMEMLEANTDYPDASNNIYLTMPSKFAVENGFNMANYKNPQVDKLLTTVETSTSGAARGRALLEVQRIMNRDLPYLSVYWPNEALAIRSKYRYRKFNGFFRLQAWATRITAR